MNLPNDFVNRIRVQLGDEADEFLASYDTLHVKSLRLNRRKNHENVLPFDERVYDNSNLQSAIIPEASRVKWENNGIYYIESEEGKPFGNEDAVILKAPGKSSLHAAGAYYIQEASAMLPVTLLDINQNESLKVLDLCASPGGKSTQIADYMDGRGLLVSNEIVASRAKILSENIERMGVTNAVVVSEDPIKLSPRFPHYFDRILVDAPCSGEGMFRKHEDAMNEWSLENVDACAKRQEYILDCAASMLDFNGRIVYSTCTFSKEEDENMIDGFLSRHPEFVRVQEDIRIFPHKERGEGHFAAVLEYREKTDRKEIAESNKKKKSKNSCDKNQLNVLVDFLSNNLNKCNVLDYASDNSKSVLSEKIINRIIMFGENMYLTPEYMPDIKGLAVLRPGLHLGSITKGRFTPSHAFALSLTKDEVKYYVDYPHESMEINGYLRGLTLSSEGENAWYLVCTEGMSVGWAKNANNCLKNHYPKGLRIMG